MSEENREIERIQQNAEFRQQKKHQEDDPPFWGNNPNILLDKDYILEFFPVESMTYEQKMNAVSRLVIVLTLIGFLMTYNFNLVIISLIILGFIFVLYNYQKKEIQKNTYLENLENPARDALLQKGIETPDFDEVFDKPTVNNPFSNVLVTDYDYNPNKKPAGPSYNENVNENILKQAKQLVNQSNPTQPNIADKLFRGLGEELEFEQSLRQFTSNPSTTIPNDQKGFAEFCYGEMISAKEGNMFSLARNLSRHTGN
jgi:hypothetical protein